MDEGRNGLQTEMIRLAEPGFTRPDLREQMKQLGWHSEAAEKILDEAFAGQDGAASDSPLPAPMPVPEPDLRRLPSVIDLGDREVRVLLSIRHPRIVIFGNFLSEEECDELIGLSRPRLGPSQIVDVTNVEGGALTSYSRTSQSVMLGYAENDLVSRIEQRSARLLNWPVTHAEDMQVVQYGPGADFEPHYDYFDLQQAATPRLTRHGGHRVGSMLMYLNTPEEGGSTLFSDVELEVMPQRGNALFFSYARPHPSSKTLHAGVPVLRGEKWLATIFMRERSMQMASPTSTRSSES